MTISLPDYGERGRVSSMAAVQIGGYSLKTKFIVNLFTFFALLVHGVSDVGTDRVSVIVMKGDTVKLHTNITINQQNRVKWYFTDTFIARLDLTHSCTDVQCEDGDARFRNRLKLDHQTGSLTITNINRSDNGVYHLKIFWSSGNSKKAFSVSVHDVAEMKRMTGKEGESVTLDSPIVKNPNDEMMWCFNDTRIAEITGDQRKICTDVQCNEGTERFRDRLKLDHKTGSLTITNTRTTDSGDYKLQTKSSRNHYNTTSIMSFSVSVTNSGLSSAAVAGICVGVGVLLLLAAAAVGVIYCPRKSSKKGSRRDRSGSQHRAGANAEHLRIVPPQTVCCASPFQSLGESESEAETE